MAGFQKFKYIWTHHPQEPEDNQYHISTYALLLYPILPHIPLVTMIDQNVKGKKEARIELIPFLLKFNFTGKYFGNSAL